MFNTDISLEHINNFSKGSMIEHLGIVFTEMGKDYVKASMPVDERTKQPFGILHGGASVTLAETLGSWAATACLDTNKHIAVGLDINANHIKSVTGGTVEAIAKPIHIGSKTHVWEIKNYQRKRINLYALAV